MFSPRTLTNFQGLSLEAINVSPEDQKEVHLANKTEANQRDTFQERKYSLDLVACKLLLILI